MYIHGKITIINILDIINMNLRHIIIMNNMLLCKNLYNYGERNC